MAGKFKAWLEGFLDGCAADDRDIPWAVVQHIRQKLEESSPRAGFTPEEVVNVEKSTIPMKAQYNPGPRAKQPTDDMVEELKHEFNVR